MAKSKDKPKATPKKVSAKKKPVKRQTHDSITDELATAPVATPEELAMLEEEAAARAAPTTYPALARRKAAQRKAARKR